jgi:hypothetical protein
MNSNLLKFEWYYHTHRPLFYCTVIAFFVIGIVAGASNGIAFPNVNINSPFQITYLVGVLSLASVFSVTFCIAQSILRDRETKFDVIVFTTPVRKIDYLGSRFAGVFCISVIAFTIAVAGLSIGHLLSPMPAERKGVFMIVNYLLPLLLLAVPNIFLFTVILCSAAWVSGNKLIIYVSGLCIYIAYIIGSVFSNSPLIAGAPPLSPSSASLFAKIDPLGMAAFFEQTRYWNALEKNTRHLSLSGDFLFNRIFWISFSSLIIILAFLRFSFRNLKTQAVKKVKASIKWKGGMVMYKPVSTEIQTTRHNYNSLISCIKLDALSILKGIPFLLIMILLSAWLGVEMYNAVQGDPRLGISHATTALMIKTIMEELPFFALLVILFYSSEVIWRSKAANFDILENTTPVHPLILFASRFFSVSIIPLLLISFSIIMGLMFQVMDRSVTIDFHLYALLFYYTGWPLLLCTMLVVTIQFFFKNKYLGLAIASVVILTTNSSLASFISLTHPLLRFAHGPVFPYAEMNGFNNYNIAFHWEMVYWSAFALSIVMGVYIFRKRSDTKVTVLQKMLLVGCVTVFLISGSYIFYQVNIQHKIISGRELNNWKEAYETKYKVYESYPKLTITNVVTKVDLYPKQQRYIVSGKYTMINNTSVSIDSVLIYTDRHVQLKSAVIENAVLKKRDTQFGHYWYKLNQPLSPKDSISMTFAFSSEWSPFSGHTPFNSIINNGSFIRISNYYPSLGYETGNEITSITERQLRGMKAQLPLKKIEEPTETPYDYGFINLDAIVSTESDQLVIGSGNLIDEWTAGDRSYFHYKTDRPIPFRFAFSSARYKIKRDTFKDISIEIFYDERHGVNVDQLITDTKKTMAYCESNFGSYPNKVIRFAEISAFAEGFAATSYPCVIYMKENGGFYNIVNKGNQEDIINTLAGHELSHQWWGCSQIDPEYREGGWILTETLAKYTELMMFRKAHGFEATLDIVRQNIDLYLSNRSFSNETPLYKTTYKTPHLPYNKGMVIMYQLEQMLGEEKVNTALRSLLTAHAYPKSPPTSEDLVEELYKVSSPGMKIAIDELFKQIIIYDSKVTGVKLTKVNNNEFQLKFEASVNKYRENGYGKRELLVTDKIDVGIITDDNIIHNQSYEVKNGGVAGTARFTKKPLRIVIDPYLKTIDSFVKDNEKVVE